MTQFVLELPEPERRRTPLGFGDTYRVGCIFTCKWFWREVPTHEEALAVQEEHMQRYHRAEWEALTAREPTIPTVEP